MPRKPRLADPLLEPDIIAFDRDDEPILAANTKTLRASAAIGSPRVLEILGASGVPFGMFVDLDDLLIFRRGCENPASPICALKTADVLSFYEPEFDRKWISPGYLQGLIEAWLHDFAFHWKSQRPPASDRLESIGLAERLDGGMVQLGGSLADPPLY